VALKSQVRDPHRGFCSIFGAEELAEAENRKGLVAYPSAGVAHRSINSGYSDADDGDSHYCLCHLKTLGGTAVARRVVGLVFSDDEIKTEPSDDLLGHIAALGWNVTLFPSSIEDRDFAVFSNQSGHQVMFSLAQLSSNYRLENLFEVFNNLDVTGLTIGSESVIATAVADAQRFATVLEDVTPSAVPPPSWFSQLRRIAVEREAILSEFGALDSDEVAEFAGSQAQNRRSTAHRWQEKGRIFSVPHHGRTIFPGFQFDSETREPKPAVAEVLRELPAAMHGWLIASWWSTPIDLLEWERPVDLLDSDPARVVETAITEARDWEFDRAPSE
jgi:hypothetical protein